MVSNHGLFTRKVYVARGNIDLSKVKNDGEWHFWRVRGIWSVSAEVEKSSKTWNFSYFLRKKIEPLGFTQKAAVLLKFP